MIKEKTGVIYTNKAKCRDCNRCVLHCPVKAIKIESGQAHVIDERCIACGTCVEQCPQNAKTYRKAIDRVKDYISDNEQLVISVAPSFAGLYSDWKRLRLPSAIRQTGFSFVSETAVGAWHTAKLSKQIIEKNPEKSHLLTACPAFVNYIEKYQPDLIKNLVPIDSPMIIHAKLLRKQFGTSAKIIFAGPCTAKKYEADRKEYKGLLDGVLTFEELEELFEWKNIDFLQCEESSFDELAGMHARNFPLEGGLLKTADISADLTSAKVFAVSGYDEIHEAAKLLKKNGSNCIIEPLFCRSGCINGPGVPDKQLILESRNALIEYSEKQGEQPETELPDIKNFTTTYSKKDAVKSPLFSEEEINATLAKFGKFTKEDRLNCSACGYDSCREKAIAVLSGRAEYEMCVPYMRRLAEAKNNVVIETSPNGIIVLNENLEIESINNTFKKMFSCNEAVLKKKISYLIDPDPFEKLAAGSEDEIRKVVHYASYNLICRQITYALRSEKKYIGMFIDITDLQNNREKLKDIKTETIRQAQDLIDHQINMAQDLAQFLGDHTAQGEMLMNRLIDAIRKE
jgi:iron only hydrogenase large subunit-like protein